MKVYYLGMDEYHGVFSSKDKAIEWFNAYAEKHGYTNIRFSAGVTEDLTVIDYNWTMNDDGNIYSGYAMITEFIIDDSDN